MFIIKVVIFFFAFVWTPEIPGNGLSNIIAPVFPSLEEVAAQAVHEVLIKVDFYFINCF
jgi:hypothetical protein